MQKGNITNTGKGIYKEAVNYDELVEVGTKTRAYHLWEFSKELSLTGLSREGFLLFFNEHGFFKKIATDGSIVFTKVTGNIVKYVYPKDILEYTKAYIWSIDKPIELHSSKDKTEVKRIGIRQLRNTFLKQYTLIINELFLSTLESDNRKILKDDKENAYLPFKNVVVNVTKKGFEIKDYTQYKDTLILESQIINREFTLQSNWKESPFVKFIINIANNQTDRKNAIRSVFGYLLHGYNNPANAQAVLLYDETLADIYTPSGGTGKGLIRQALENIKAETAYLNGKGLKLDSQFLFQTVKDGTPIVFIDDVSKTFNIDVLNSILTEGLIVEKKFKSPFHILKEDMPKFVIASNIILASAGTTRARRQFVIELSDYYSTKIKEGVEQPIVAEHGTTFFKEEWNSFEWNGFYTFIIKCIQYYLANGLQKPLKLNMHINQLLQRFGKPLYDYFETLNPEIGKEYDMKDMLGNLKAEGIVDENYGQRILSDNFKAYLSSKSLRYTFKKSKAIIA
ncbi:primase-helicase family protein [Pedobacter sp. ASV1-7]|uniref:primase-helicase family protein n=1 Tax=Pedobacter sp. ASV1-7 TaxID=3145237 RepID=UPI0032E8BA4A